MATPVVACGFECGVLPSAGHHLQSGIGSPSFDTTTFRSGLRALRCDATAALVSGTLVFTGSTVAVGRVYIRFASLPSADCILADWDSSTNANIWFKASDSKLYARIGTTAGASGIAVTTGQWYRLDFKWDDTNNTSDLQVDGVAAGQARAAFSVAVPGRIPFGLLTSVTADIYFDDLILSVTAVDYPLGAGFVKSYIPNADGLHNVAGANDFEKTLTGTDITNATTDAWQLIDDRPLPTTSVDFVNGIGPPNSTDYVEWQYEDSAEANAPRAVEGLIVYHDASGAGTNNFSVTLREHAGGTSADIMAPATRNVGATITYARAQFATVPGTSDAWTTVKFNALRSRFLVSDASPDPYIDAAMLEAEFSSAAGTNAPAENAAGTGTANAPSIGLAPAAGLSSGTGVANAAAANIQPKAGVASGTGAVSDATTQVAPTAGNAAGTGAASNATTKIDATAGVASGTGAASDATVALAKDALAEAATGAGAAYGVTAQVAGSAALAAGTGAASDATVVFAHDAPAEAATGTGAAAGATTHIEPTADATAGTGAAADAAASVAPTAEVAAGTGAASDATVSTGGTFVEANAENAAGAGAAYGATTKVEPVIAAATGTGAAAAATTNIAPTADAAAGTGAAFDEIGRAHV